LGGQVVSELNGSGVFQRGYVYLGSQMLAIQQNNQVSWVHQDPVTKSQRITNSSGVVTSTIDLDPWGGETSRSSNQAFQPHRYTTYERDGNGGDEAMMRRYTGKWHRFAQPDPYGGSYDLTNPQSFNRYAYVQNDPVNLVDPTGLDLQFSMPDWAWEQVPWDRWWDLFNGTFQVDGFFGGPGGNGIVGDPQNPSTVRNATQDQQSRFNDAYNEFWKRLHANNGKNPCADLFGGIKNAEKALKGTKFSFGPTEGGAGAVTLGKNVTIDPNGIFMGTSGSETIQVGFNLRDKQGSYITLNNVQAAAFVLAHETGHRAGKLRSDGNDPFGFLSVMNNGDVQKACFGDVTPSIGPLPPGFR
jgi:RHS repeat-associated protein